jgi:iron-sulfur cluster assembly protein
VGFYEILGKTARCAGFLSLLTPTCGGKKVANQFCDSDLLIPKLTISYKSDKIYKYFKVFQTIKGKSMTTKEKTSIITITESAAQAVEELLNERQLDGYGLRLFLSGGGCSGYQYGMSLDNNPMENDSVTMQSGIKLIIDDLSLQYLEGATIDYVTNEMGTGFKIDNPNELPVSSCGCGSQGSSESSQSCGCGGGGGGCGCGC